eukprot:10126724-Alexandrium_andersonii.AAC.1
MSASLVGSEMCIRDRCWAPIVQLSSTQYCAARIQSCFEMSLKAQWGPIGRSLRARVQNCGSDLPTENASLERPQTWAISAQSVFKQF